MRGSGIIVIIIGLLLLYIAVTNRWQLLSEAISHVLTGKPLEHN